MFTIVQLFEKMKGPKKFAVCDVVTVVLREWHGRKPAFLPSSSGDGSFDGSFDMFRSLAYEGTQMSVPAYC